MSDFSKNGFLAVPDDTLRSIFGLIVFVVISLATFKFYHAGLLSLPLIANWGQPLSNDDFQKKCLEFKPKLPAAQVELIEYLSEGTRPQIPYRDITCGGPTFQRTVTKDVCRVALYIQTSQTSGIHFEAWSPKDWNNRFLATGNGGLNGCLSYIGLLQGNEHGFAAVATNNGHNGTSGKPFYNNPEVLADYADRSIHNSATAGKELVQQFYGSSQKKSYYIGCSQGGRQGVASAEKFPNDFDGIIAGAPALDFNGLVSWRASFYPVTGLFTSKDFIKPEVWSGLIHDEVLRQCDAIDGVKDGIIEYPDLCQFKPETLLCNNDKQVNCLSKIQVDQVNRFFSPFTHPDGSIIYSGMQAGSEKRAIDRLYSGKPFSDSQDWFRYVVHNNPAWDPITFGTDDARAAQTLNPFNLRTFPTPDDLLLFRQRGGKILTYHGMQDQQITGHNTARWFELLRSKSSDAQLDEWIRYFRISGMYHCASGPGAWMIGQAMGSASYEPQHNVLSAIVRWVEEGVAPEEIEGIKLADDVAAMSGKYSDVLFTRRHCREIATLVKAKKDHHRHFQQPPIGRVSKILPIMTSLKPKMTKIGLKMEFLGSFEQATASYTNLEPAHGINKFNQFLLKLTNPS